MAKDRILAAAALSRDYQAMVADYARDPRFIMEPYALGTGVATAWNGKVEVPVFVGEWLDGFHELHLYPEHNGRFSVWLDHRTERGTPLSREESDQIRVSIGKIQALYYPVGLQDMTFSKARINGGDFVAQRQPDGSWRVMMIWHRAYHAAAGLEEKKPITSETRRWEAGLDVVTPVNEADLPGFAQWIAWNGAASHLLHQRTYRVAAFDWAAYLNTKGEAVLGFPPGTLVRAIASGRVVKAIQAMAGSGYHGLVEIEHGAPDRGLSSTYVHVVPSVKTGDYVEKGAAIGRLYAESDGTMLVHLHSELANAFPEGSSPYVFQGTGGHWGKGDRYWVDPETTIYSDIPFLRANPQRAFDFRLHGMEREAPIIVSGAKFLEDIQGQDKKKDALSEVTSSSFRRSGNEGALARARALLKDPALGLSQAERERLVSAFPELAAEIAPVAGGLEERVQEFADLVGQVEQIFRRQEKQGSLRKRIDQIESTEFFTEGGVAFIPHRRGKMVVLGDRHGDFATLEKELALMRKVTGYNAASNRDSNEPIYLVFVGDYTDVGKKTLPVLLQILRLKVEDPEHVILISGNHDRSRNNYQSPDFVNHLEVGWFFRDLDNLLGGQDRAKEIYDRWQRLVLGDSVSGFWGMPNLVVSPNGTAVIHASPPNATIDAPDYGERFDSQQGLLGVARHKSILHQLSWNFINRAKADQDSAAVAQPNTRFEPVHDWQHKGFWTDRKDFETWMDSFGGAILIRGHDSEAPWDWTPYGGRVLTLMGLDWRSPDNGYDPAKKIRARFAVFDLARRYDRIDPNEVLHFAWKESAAGLEEDLELFQVLGPARLDTIGRLAVEETRAFLDFRAVLLQAFRQADLILAGDETARNPTHVSLYYAGDIKDTQAVLSDFQLKEDNGGHDQIEEEIRKVLPPGSEAADRQWYATVRRVSTGQMRAAAEDEGYEGRKQVFVRLIPFDESSLAPFLAKETHHDFFERMLLYLARVVGLILNMLEREERVPGLEMRWFSPEGVLLNRIRFDREISLKDRNRLILAIERWLTSDDLASPDDEIASVDLEKPAQGDWQIIIRTRKDRSRFITGNYEVDKATLLMNAARVLGYELRQVDPPVDRKILRDGVAQHYGHPDVGLMADQLEISPEDLEEMMWLASKGNGDLLLAVDVLMGELVRSDAPSSISLGEAEWLARLRSALERVVHGKYAIDSYRGALLLSDEVLLPMIREARAWFAESAAGLEEREIRQAMAVLDEAAPQEEGILVLEAGVLGRAGLEEFVARVGPKLGRRFVLFGKESAAAKEAAARSGILLVDSDDPADLAFRLAGLEERAGRIGYVGNRRTAELLANILPPSMPVTPLDPAATLPELFRFLGYPASFLGQINASGLEESLERSRAA